LTSNDLGESRRVDTLPSGKRLHNYEKSPVLIGKSAINGTFSIAMLVYQRVIIDKNTECLDVGRGSFQQGMIIISMRQT
jgi:hypothetical protein